MAVEEARSVQPAALDLYIAPMGEAALRHCAILAADIRKLDLSIEVGTDRKLKRMLELSNKQGARFTLIVGDNEIATRSYTLKDMASGEQETLTREGLLRTSTMAEVKLDFLGDLRRTHSCGELRRTDAGANVVLMGWVHRRRDSGGLIFIHLRDRYGITQLVFDESKNPTAHRRAQELGSEFVIAVEGIVKLRSKETVNPNIATGEVEVAVSKLWILNESRTPPFPLEDEVDVKEDVRLKYRYIDLRRPRMQHNIIMRSKITLAVRQALYGAELPRNRNAVHDALDPGGRARLPSA